MGGKCQNISKVRKVARGALESLEKRILLSASSFTTSDYFPLIAGTQWNYVGSSGPAGSNISASNHRTATVFTGNGTTSALFTDTITLSGQNLPSTHTEDFAINGSGLEFYGMGPYSTTAPIQLLNAVANVGDVLPWYVALGGLPQGGGNISTGTETGTSTVEGLQNVTLQGGQSVPALEVVIDDTTTVTTGAAEGEFKNDVTTAVQSTETLWLEAGVGIVQYNDDATTTLSYSDTLGTILPTTSENIDHFTLVPNSAVFPVTLTFGQEPNNVALGQAVSPSPTVAVLMGNGQIDTQDNSIVTLSVLSGPTGGVVGGAASVRSVNGVATFNDLTFSVPGAYTLEATDGILTPADSTGFETQGSLIENNGGEVIVSAGNGNDTIAAGTLDLGEYYFLVQAPGQPEVEETLFTSNVTGLVINAGPSNGPGSSADDDLINLGGDDFGFAVSINGGAGSDTVIGQQGPNIVTTGIGSAHNLIYGSIGADVITSQGTSDTLRSGGGADTITAHAGNNFLAGGKDGSDLLGGSGYDTLMAGRGNSTLSSGLGSSLLIGGFGNDSFADGTGNDTIIAGSGIATGGAADGGGFGADFLDAGWDAYLQLQGQAALPAPVGSDHLIANSPNDTLVANSGTPTLTGASSGFNSFEVNDTSAILQNVTAGNFVAQNDTVASATQTLSVHLSIKVVNSGITYDVEIPMGAGAAPSGTSAAETTDANGTVVFRSSAPRTFILGDFFHHWGVDFSSMGVGQFIASPNSGNSLAMTVNGVANAQLNSYVVQNNDDIVITATL